MKREDFTKFIEDHVLSIFTGSEIIGFDESNSRDAIVALGVNGTMLVKFNRLDNYRIIIKRVQPFKSFEINLVKTIIEEMSDLYSSNLGPEYIKDMEAYLIEKAICIALSNSASKTLHDILRLLEAWGQRTYEGNHIGFGFVISNKRAGKQTNPNLNISKLLKTDFSALLGDGINTVLEISLDGYLINYLTAPKQFDQELLVPYNYIRIASLCTGNKIGVSLMRNGDILLFKDKTLLFARRNGNWVCFSHEEIISKLADRSGDYTQEVRKAIYLSALDTSFARTGGCIVHLNKEDYYNVLKHIDICDCLNSTCYDYKLQETMTHSFFADFTEPQELPTFEEFIKEEKMTKTANLIQLIGGRKFSDLDRKLRLELMSIDGATVIDADGNILAVGAIIKIEAGSTGGGRLAAAKTLSKYGMSIKISNDGRMEGFRMDKNKLRVRPLFVLG
ncbi:MAG: hypothetical protein J5689_02125 [Clostridia bacterium]|nr:hypothetical protein [Clostridia bacterium]